MGGLGTCEFRQWVILGKRLVLIILTEPERKKGEKHRRLGGGRGGVEQSRA
jgi:hypothetical protein